MKLSASDSLITKLLVANEPEPRAAVEAREPSLHARNDSLRPTWLATAKRLGLNGGARVRERGV